MSGRIILHTMTKATGHYEGALLEEINNRLKLVQEALDAFKTVPDDVRGIKERQDKTDTWSDVAKSVIKSQSKTLNNHETRLTKLETA